MDMEIRKIILILLPLVIINLIFVVISLLDLSKRKKVLFENKIIWALLIIFFQYFGWMLYFLIGRKDE